MSIKTSVIFPTVPDKQYFSIGEVSTLCRVKAHVLRYWESEFHQLKPLKRKGNRRYYKKKEVLLVRKIRELLYDEGYTISGAKMRLSSETIQTKTSSSNDTLNSFNSLNNSSNGFANPDFFSNNNLNTNIKDLLSEVLDILHGSKDNN
ncbi:MAG: hypothetical protein CBC01_00480 [Betaproteobacteria bacterium TMED41]|nr:MAG: hypothetical protein CBC01_00480 [Betaproteobacteria bacterium TMED41]|tara:strand:+ start:442 stop:885 length:444 start_codon:yes stop_codon:yes gene_type:complete